MYRVLDHSYLCKRYAMEEAINNLKQLCHPSMMDEPDALVNIKIEFDMKASKKDRYNFWNISRKTVCIIVCYNILGLKNLSNQVEPKAAQSLLKFRFSIECHKI